MEKFLPLPYPMELSHDMKFIFSILRDAYQICHQLGSIIPSIEEILEEVWEISNQYDIDIDGPMGERINKDSLSIYIELALMEAKHEYKDFLGNTINDAQIIVVDGMCGIEYANGIKSLL